MIKKVPIKYDGRVVGEAEIDDEGKITNVTITDPDLSEELFGSVETSHFSFGPIEETVRHNVFDKES